MDHEGATSPKTTFLVRVPLLVAYLATPLALAASRVDSGLGQVSLDAPWLLLAGVGGLLFALRRGPSRAGSSGRVLVFLALAALGVYVMPEALATLYFWLPALAEIRPLVYLLFCLLWAYSFGPPSREDFQRYGAVLGLLVLADLAAGTFLFPGWPGLRWLGDPEVVATMLLVSLCAGLRPGLVGVRRLEFDDGLGWARALILLGIAGCMSRTGLFVACWVYLFFGRGSLVRRIPVGLALGALAVATVLLYRAVLAQGGQMVDIWAWSRAGAMFLDSPLRLLTGYPPDVPLILDLPPHIEHLWGSVFGMSASSGLFVHMVHPFWLRLALGWGVGPMVALFAALLVLLIRRPTIFGAALTAVFVGQGLAAPMLFDPASAVALCLGLFPAFRLARGPVAVRRPPAERAPGSGKQGAGDGSDSVDFEMKPL